MNKQCKEWITEFETMYPNRKLLFLCKAGSHFFNLAGPNSDLDYKGIYMPAPEEFYAGESRRKQHERKTNKSSSGSKNTNEDTDFLLFSYTKFMELLKRGDFNCMELLHCPDDKILIDSPEFQELRAIKQNLLVNDISAFLGFIKKEYKRYGINIHHYEAQEQFRDFLLKFEPHSRLKDHWQEILEFGESNPMISFTMSDTGNNNIIPTIKIAQRLHQSTFKVQYVIDAITKVLETYGHRQKKMATDGVEFKGLYHALRLIYEANDLFDYGEFHLPFSSDRREMLRAIKEGYCNEKRVKEIIDRELDLLYNREKTVKTNKSKVGYVIDKMMFLQAGKMELEHILRRNT